MRYVTALLGLPFVLLLAGCGERERRSAPPGAPTAVVPYLYGENLDEAEEQLDGLGISYSVDSGDDRVVFEHLWEVCDQDPEPGTASTYVALTVEHWCDDD
jgi:PASTA domain